MGTFSITVCVSLLGVGCTTCPFAGEGRVAGIVWIFDGKRRPLSSPCAVTISSEYRPHSHASVCVSVTSPLVSQLSGRQPPLSDVVSVFRFICNRLTQVTNRVLCPTCVRNSSATVSVEWHKAYTVSAIFLHNCITWGMWPVAYVLYKRLCVSASCVTALRE